jgi:hypothetical protein
MASANGMALGPLHKSRRAAPVGKPQTLVNQSVSAAFFVLDKHFSLN